MDDTYDAVVVGSGFGGGITACRLAEAGWRVCVLERGRRFGRGDFPDRPAQAPAMLWHRTLNPGGMFDVRLMRDLSVVTAAGVGGGSLVYANVQLRAPAGAFEGSGWPAQITRSALDPYYDRTEDALEPVPTPDGLRKLAAFDALAARAGMTAERLPLAVNFEAERLNPFSGVPQGRCENLARCNIGCPLHAKNTVDITYVARAEQVGAEVFPLHEVERLERAAGGGWQVSYRDLETRARGVVSAPVVVLAAGTIGSTRLLLKNRRRIGSLSPALGTRFSGNGDALGGAFDPQRPELADARMDVGPVMTSRFDLWDDGRMMVADGALPENFSGLLKIVRGMNAATGWRRVLLRVLDVVARLGGSDRAVPPRAVNLKPDRPITDALVFLMIGQDAANGRMRLTPLLRTLDIRWDKRASQGLFDRMEATTDRLAQAADGERHFALDGGPLGKFITVHPLGGCPMSDSPARGVVDAYGAVHGAEGLYVFDGSIVPSALGVNPSKTIAALAERNVEKLLERRA
ncbi:MAG: GMC oxidoreductase [Thermoleophilaceae bacterium]